MPSPASEEFMTRLLLAFGLVLATAAPSLAQPTQLRPGDAVRVTTETTTGRFTVSHVNSGTLSLRDSAGAVVEVPMISVSRLAVYRGPRTAGAGAVRGLAIGLAAGAGAGILIGLASGDDSGHFLAFTAEEKALMGGVMLGGAGGLIGALIGAAAPGQRWERIPLTESARVGVSRDGGIAVAYALRF